MFPIYWIGTGYIDSMGLATYILVGTGLAILAGIPIFRLANERNIKNTYLAFIPFLQLIPLGMVMGNLKLLEYDLFDADYLIIVVTTACLIFLHIPYIGILFKIGLYLLFMLIIITLVNRYTENWSIVAVSVLSCLFKPYLFIIVLWLCMIKSIRTQRV